MKKKILNWIVSGIILTDILISLFLGGLTFKAIYNYNTTTECMSEYQEYGSSVVFFGHPVVDGIISGTVLSVIVFGGSLVIIYLSSHLIIIPFFYFLDRDGWNKHQKEMKKNQEKIDRKNRQKQLKLILIEKRLEEARRCKNPDMEKIRQLLIQQNNNLAQQTNVVEQMYPWIVVGAIGSLGSALKE